jgi:hypothetical protein
MSQNKFLPGVRGVGPHTQSGMLHSILSPYPNDIPVLFTDFLDLNRIPKTTVTDTLFNIAQTLNLLEPVPATNSNSSVMFESHKHLKAWLKEKCTQEPLYGADKNGRRTTQTIWKLGTTPIDWKVYQKGDWRFPLCAKGGSHRILKYDHDYGHYIEADARPIEVQLSGYTKKRKKQVELSGALSNEEKERFNLEGQFEWYLLKNNGQLARAKDSWRCPFQVEHLHNKTVKVKTDAVYCYGCNKEFSLAKREKKEFSELPKVPHLLPDDLFIGTDKAYAKIMLTLYGENFVYTRRGLYCWNGDIWCDGEDQAFYKIEDLYIYLSLQLEDHRGPTQVVLPEFDVANLQQARVACTDKEQVLNRLKKELSNLKLEQLKASQKYEQDILDAEDGTELKARAPLINAHLPVAAWCFAITEAARIANLLPCSSNPNGQSPYEMVTGEMPHINMLSKCTTSIY